MYSMHEVHQLVSEHHNSLVRDAERARRRSHLRAASAPASRQRTGGLWEKVAALASLWGLRQPALSAAAKEQLVAQMEELLGRALDKRLV